MWQVILDQQPTVNDFRQGFFPRNCYYKKEAEALAAEVVQKGGKAHIQRRTAIQVSGDEYRTGRALR